MSLGVLNNLNALYAENNLNSTQSSLSTVLNQLSSGSKINSGADDAAGLSLVDGLQANNMALMQSQTNASEGVGLLTVADGALSQVNNLLNRAVTLATEASNGTLNSSQDTAANQEYQSILSEISNIGTTTTYNNNQVFNSNINIFTGDSSSVGASVDSLNIRTLSSSNVGDTGGTMAYSTGANGTNVFVDLSNDGTNATANDSLGLSTATTAVQVSYLQTGAGGAVSPTSATITVGSGTNYANNVQGLISAINGSGLGLTATFGTAAQAGGGAAATAGSALVGGGASADTGIIISGVGVGTGTSAGEIGNLAVTGTKNDQLAGSLTVTGANGSAHTITLGSADSTDTLTNLAATINAAGYGITAAVAGGTALTFTSGSSMASVSGTGVTDAVTAVDGTAPAVAATAIKGNVAGSIGTFTLGNATDIITGGTLVLTGQAGVANAAITLGGVAGVKDDSLANLAKTITNLGATGGNYAGLSATVSGAVLTIASAGGGLVGATTAVAFGVAGTSDTVAAVPTAVSLTATPTLKSASSSTIGTLTLGGTGESVTDQLNGTLTLGSATLTLGGTGTTDTLQDGGQDHQLRRLWSDGHVQPGQQGHRLHVVERGDDCGLRKAGRSAERRPIGRDRLGDIRGRSPGNDQRRLLQAGHLEQRRHPGSGDGCGDQCCYNLRRDGKHGNDVGPYRFERHGHYQLYRQCRPVIERNRLVQPDRRAIGFDRPQRGHHRRSSPGRLHRRADQHTELGELGVEHAIRERDLGAERGAGYRLCVGNLEHVEVRNSEPDRHLGPGPGQQHAAGSDQAACSNA